MRKNTEFGQQFYTAAHRIWNKSKYCSGHVPSNEPTAACQRFIQQNVSYITILIN